MGSLLYVLWAVWAASAFVFVAGVWSSARRWTTAARVVGTLLTMFAFYRNDLMGVFVLTLSTLVLERLADIHLDGYGFRDFRTRVTANVTLNAMACLTATLLVS